MYYVIKHLILLKVRSMTDINVDLIEKFLNFLIKNFSGSDVESEIGSDQQLFKDLHKPTIRKFKKRNTGSSFKDNICSTCLADMELISKFNKQIRFLLCVIEVYNKYAWVAPLKDKKRCYNCYCFLKIFI